MAISSDIAIGQRRQARRSAGGGGHRLLLLALPAVLMLAGAYLLPVGTVLLSSFDAPHWSLASYAQVLGDGALWSLLWRTIVMAAEVTLACALLGYPIAYTMLIASARWQKIVTLLIVVPMWTSTLVRAYAWMVLLGRGGIINQVLIAIGLYEHPVQFLYTRFAVVVGLVHVMLPYFVLPVFGVMKRIDPRLVSAAESLGAGRISSFFCVFLPLTLPGVASGGLLVFVLAIGFFVTPSLLGGLHETTYVMIIEKQVNQFVNWDIAAAMSVILLATTGILVVLWSKLLGFGAVRGELQIGSSERLGRAVSIVLAALAPIRLALRAPWQAVARPARTRRPRSHRFVAAVTVVTIAFILLPILILFPLGFSGSPYLQFPPPTYSLRWYANYLSRADWTGPTMTSFEVAFITMALATALGSLAAIAIARGRFPGRGLCLGLLTAPAITPTLIIAVGLYFEFARWGLVGTISGLVLAHLVIAIPLVVVVVLGALRRVDAAPERAACSLGAHPAKAFLLVTLPLIRPSILSAALFAFLASFDDVVMALFLSGTSAATLPKRMWDGIILEIDPTVAAVSTLLIVLSGLFLATSQLVKRAAARRGGVRE